MARAFSATRLVLMLQAAGLLLCDAAFTQPMRPEVSGSFEGAVQMPRSLVKPRPSPAGQAVVRRAIVRPGSESMTEGWNQKQLWDAYRLSNFDRKMSQSRGETYTSMLHRAVDLCNKLITVNPKNFMAYAIRGWSQFQLRQYTAAVSDMTEAIKLEPGCKKFKLLRALANYRNGRIDDAYADFQSLSFTYELSLSMSGIIQMKKGNYQDALASLNYAVQKNSQSARLLMYRSDVHRTLDQLTESDSDRNTIRKMRVAESSTTGDRLQDLDTAISCNPNSNNLMKDRGQIYMDLGQNFLALEDFDKAMKLGDEASIAKHDKVMDLLSNDTKEQIERAVQGLDAVSETRRKDDVRVGNTYKTAAQDCLKSGNFQNALGYLDKAIAFNKFDPALYAMRAKVLERFGKSSDALLDLSEAIRIWPEDVESLKSRIRIYEKTGQWSNALSDYGSLMKLQPHDQDTFNKHFALAVKLNDHKAVIKDCSAILKKSPHDKAALGLRARHYEANKDPAHAVKDLEELFNANPSDKAVSQSLFFNLNCLCGADDPKSKYLVKRGDAHNKLHEYTLALSDYQRALEVNPEEKLLDKIATAKRNIKKPPLLKDMSPDEQLASCNKRLETDPNDMNARRQKAWILFRTNKLEDARIEFDNLISRGDPSHGGMGFVLEKLGKPDEALAEYDIAIQATPTEGWLYMRRATLNKARGNLEAATKDLEQARALNFSK